MSSRIWLVPVGVAALVIGVASWPAAAQDCTPAWDLAFSNPGANEDVRTLAFWDDGTGRALYAGGSFTSVGGIDANYIAKWDGQKWTSLGEGTSAPDGGVQWEPGSGIPLPYVRVIYPVTEETALGPPRLYVGGNFTHAGGQLVNGIATWDGANWAPVGGGFGGFQLTVRGLLMWDDGTGQALYACGFFTEAEGKPASLIAKWDGTQWTEVGGGLGGAQDSPTALNMLLWDDGLGEALYVWGGFGFAGDHVSSTHNIAKWDGVEWHTLGDGMDGRVSTAAVWDDGTGEALYAGGRFTTADGEPAEHIAKWDGERWTELGGGTSGGTGGYVYWLFPYNDGTGEALYAVGEFDQAGDVPANYIAKWDGLQWSAVGGGFDGTTWILLGETADPVFRGLYVGGLFHTVDGQAGSKIARWVGCPVPDEPTEPDPPVTDPDPGTGPGDEPGDEPTEPPVTEPGDGSSDPTTDPDPADNDNDDASVPDGPLPGPQLPTGDSQEPADDAGGNGSSQDAGADGSGSGGGAAPCGALGLVPLSAMSATLVGWTAFRRFTGSPTGRRCRTARRTNADN